MGRGGNGEMGKVLGEVHDGGVVEVVEGSPVVV